MTAAFDQDFASRWANPHVPALHAYVPGTQPAGTGWIKLNTNELPYAASPEVAKAIAAECSQLPKYPSPDSAPLRAALAEHHGLAPDQVFVGNGSDEVLSLLVRVFSGPGRPVGQIAPSYSLYPVLAAAQQAPISTVPIPEDLSLPLEDIAALRVPLFFLTSPNAPFGVGFDPGAIEEAVARFEGIFVIDEAYGDFSGESATELLGRHANVVITRTFSKSYGLAGLRVGYALAAPATIRLLDRIRDSYNVNRLSQAGALAALKDTAYLEEVVRKVRETRARVSARLGNEGWEVLRSRTNFVFARPPARATASRAEAAQSAFRYLEGQKILTRYFPGHPLTATGLRITIGTDPQMDRCLEELSTWLNHA